MKMRGPESLALSCGCWSFISFNDPITSEVLLELRWQTHGGELRYRSRYRLSERQLLDANFDLEGYVWSQLERGLLSQLEA